MIPAGFSCSDCRFPGNGNSAEMGKVCQDGNWGLKSRHSASPSQLLLLGGEPLLPGRQGEHLLHRGVGSSPAVPRTAPDV